MIKKTITFGESSKMDIISMFGLTTDDKGYVVNKTTKEYAISFNGRKFKINEFAGVMTGKNGEPLYLLSDLPSLIELSDLLKERQ